MAVKQMIGYVGGGFRYYPMNTLAAIRKAYAPFYPTWDQGKYERLLAQFDLSERKRVKELSEGMKVKFALALAPFARRQAAHYGRTDERARSAFA